ncbi:MAG TPA: glycosyltransferase family 2 protein, partial [Thermoanaerobaculia bacterium]
MTRDRSKKVVVVLPAYNAEKTLLATYNDIPKDWVDEILLVDDASRDRTVEIAQGLGMRTIVHPENRGYGGNQKTCYRTALELGGDIMVMVHPDHQYDPTIIPQRIKPLLLEECDAVFGSRMLGGRPIEGGMPKWKYFANLFLTMIENATFYIFLSEYHSGFRAYSR